MRISSILLLIVSILITCLGLWSAHSADEIGQMGQFLSTGQPNPIDGRDFANHWLLVSEVMVVAGITGTISGIGMFRRRRWSFALLGCVCSVLALSTVVLWELGYSRYAFEQIDPIEFTLTIAVAVASFITYFRSGHNEQAT